MTTPNHWTGVCPVPESPGMLRPSLELSVLRRILWGLVLFWFLVSTVTQGTSSLCRVWSATLGLTDLSEFWLPLPKAGVSHWCSQAHL